MTYPHWDYFLALDADLVTASRYVEISEENFGTYSTEFTRLLLALGSEIDVVAKLICRDKEPDTKANSIKGYRDAIMKHYPRLPEIQAFLPKRGMEFYPWRDWLSDKTPGWWSTYNNVKHERDIHYAQASLESCLLAMSALLVLLVHYYRDALYKHELSGWPHIVSLRGVGRIVLGQEFDLPGLGKSQI